ncbi:MAG: LemA family protein [candidate division NC10 bacterium]|nr:LemA family protein [candidate division NC10 bacterium]MDE2321809.1 LemA family protein [candidate division NC10 bacterium]
MDEGIRSAWAQVENQFQRRADLIPNLVATVKGYAAHEREVLESIADARARMAGAKSVEDKISSSNALDVALGRLLVVVERYPNLKADRSFIRLMDELAGTENRLAVERKRYNELVQGYNSRIRSFPERIVAGLFHFQQASYFQAAESAKAAPTVEFAK